MLELRHKSKTRGRETKVYIRQDIWDLLELLYFKVNSKRMGYGVMNRLINDCLMERVKRWQGKDEAVGRIEHIAHLNGAEAPDPFAVLSSTVLRVARELEAKRQHYSVGKMGKHSGGFDIVSEADIILMQGWVNALVDAAKTASADVDFAPRPPGEEELLK